MNELLVMPKIKIHTNDTSYIVQGRCDTFILDSTEKSGLKLPYSCRRGVCLSCACELISGQIEYFGKKIDGPAKDVLICRATPLVDCDIRPKSALLLEERPLRKYQAIVRQVDQLSGSVIRLRVRLPIGKKIAFRAGEYCDFLLENEASRSYSIASPEQENDTLDFHIRKIDGGIFSDKILKTLGPGDKIWLEGPRGNTDLTNKKIDRLYLIFTGTGYGAVRSIILTNIKARVRPIKQIFVYGGARYADELYFERELKTLEAEYSWLKVKLACSRESVSKGVSSRILDIAISEYTAEPNDAVFACGNPTMVEAAQFFFRKSLLDTTLFFADYFVPAQAQY